MAGLMTTRLDAAAQSIVELLPDVLAEEREELCAQSSEPIRHLEVSAEGVC